MNTHSLSRRSERVLLRDATAHHAQELEGRNKLVADIAEIDARKAYRRAGYDSIHSYCMSEFDLTAKAAFHRIHVARVAWRFPAVLAALQAGRLHVTAVRMLAPKLSAENAEELIAAVAHKTKAEIERLLAERFPRPEGSALLLEVLAASAQSASVPMELPGYKRPPGDVEIPTPAPAPGFQRPPGGVEAPAAVTLVPALPPRFPLKVSLTRETHEKLRHARELLGHQVPSGDVAEVLDRALDALITKLEKRKFAATDRPRARKSGTARDSRYIPAEVRRAVAARDGGQCTFTTESGKRCQARKLLEFDHIEPVARGGRSSVDNIRLLCRAHNQLVAEETYGLGFMNSKRQEAAEWRRGRAIEEVIPYLRALGCNTHEARRAAAGVGTFPDAPLEERVRVAVSQLGPRGFIPRNHARLAESSTTHMSP